jgi:2-iminoacetate synthase
MTMAPLRQPGASWEAMVPLYVDTHCDGACTMCGLRSGNKSLIRTSARSSDVAEQLRIIRDGFGITSVSFVSGEYWPGKHRDYHIAAIESWSLLALSLGFEKIFLNIGTLTQQEIAQLKRSGIPQERVSLSVFQETYDQERYRHSFGSMGRSPKADFMARRHALSCWIDGGFKLVNLGILLGLGPPECDIRDLIEHAKELHCLGATEVAVSLPRIRGVNAPNHVGDDDYIEIVREVAEELPWSKLVVTTREPIEIIRQVLPWVRVISPGSSDYLPYRWSGSIPNRRASSQFVVQRWRKRPSDTIDALGLPLGTVAFYTQKSAGATRGSAQMALTEIAGGQDQQCSCDACADGGPEELL